MEEKCANCRYWLEKTDGQGFCRRYPPMPVVNITTLWVEYAQESSGHTYSTDPEHYFPETVADEWCGEWKEIECKNINGRS